MALKRLTHDEWLALGQQQFGSNYEDWKFVCPVCGNAARVGDFKAYASAGATPDSATCECIGRYQPGRKAFGDNPPANSKKTPCDYAGYGLFRLSPWVVVMPDGKERHSFAFAEK